MIPAQKTNGRFTLDTNLLVYAVDKSAGVKQALAREITLRSARRDCYLTLQAVSEFYASVSRKRIMPIEDVAARSNDFLSTFRCAAVSAAAIRSALADAVARRASYWDALLVATAAEVGCTVILTEDLSDGSALNGVEIHNPFAAGGGLTDRTRELLGL
jgi:predicted nucleic acid-binding protein